MSATTLNPVDVVAVLQPPPERHADLRVPREWRTWDALFQTARDGINEFLSVVDKVPEIELGRLPEGSLADLVIKPLCGDWDRIRRNGDACEIAGRAMRGVSRNVAVTPLRTADLWWGRSSLAACAHVETYAVVTRGMADLVHTADVAFAGISRMSVALGEAAIAIIVPLGKLLVRVATKIAKRLGGWVAWVRTAEEVARRGLGPVIDIYRDVKAVIDLVEQLQRLHVLVRDWVAEARAELGALRSLPDLVAALPRLGHRGSGGQVVLPDVTGSGAAEALDNEIAEALDLADGALSSLRGPGAGDS